MGFRMIGLLMGALILLAENSVEAQLTAEVSTEAEVLPSEAGGPARLSQEFASLQWEETREDLLVGIDLSSEQASQILIIGERATRNSIELIRLRNLVLAAQHRKEVERERLLILEFNRLRLESQISRRLDEIRAVLTEAQRDAFDLNADRWSERRAALFDSPEASAATSN